MLWGQLRKYFVEAAGNATQAEQEAYDHLTEGLRRVISSVEIPQIYATKNYTVTADTDRVTLDSDCYHVSTVFNTTDGIPCHEEPDGVGGRNRHLLKTTAKPAAGPVTHWWRDGTSLLVRSMPTEATTLSVRYMLQISTVADADLNSSPITPAQYDMAIVQGALMSYLSVHPADNTMIDPERNITRLQVATQQFQVAIGGPKPVYREENKMRRENMRMPGYSVTPRSRMGGR